MNYKKKDLIYTDSKGNKFYCVPIHKSHPSRKVRFQLLIDQSCRGISNDDLFASISEITNHVQKGENQQAIELLVHLQVECCDVVKLDLLANFVKCLTCLNDEPNFYEVSSVWEQQKEVIFSTDKEAYFFLINWVIEYMKMYPDMVKEEIEKMIRLATESQKPCK